MPDAKILLQLYDFEPETCLVKLRFERDPDTALLDFEAQKLQPDPSLGQGDEAERTRAHDDPVGITLMPVKDQRGAPHIKRSAMREHMAGAEQQGLAVQTHADPKPVCGRHQRGDGRLDIGRVE